MPDEIILQKRARWHFLTGLVVLYSSFAVCMFAVRMWME